MVDILEELDCMTPGQAVLFNQPEVETYTARAATEIRRLRAELAKAQQHDSWRATAHWKNLAIVLAGQRDKAEVAIARVRELCHDFYGDTLLAVGVVDVLRALDGAE